jgi:hypothetical protein
MKLTQWISSAVDPRNSPSSSTIDQNGSASRVARIAAPLRHDAITGSDPTPGSP